METQGRQAELKTRSSCSDGSENVPDASENDQSSKCHGAANIMTKWHGSAATAGSWIRRE